MPASGQPARGEPSGSAGGAPASDELTETELRVAQASGPGPLEQGDRRRAVHGRQHRRDAPLARLFHKLGVLDAAWSFMGIGLRLSPQGRGPATKPRWTKPSQPRAFLVSAPTALRRTFDGMVYVVERYLPGLVCRELQRSLQQLEHTADDPRSEDRPRALPRLDDRSRGRGLLLRVRCPVRRGCRGREPARRPPLRPDRPRPDRRPDERRTPMSATTTVPTTIQLSPPAPDRPHARRCRAGSGDHLGAARLRRFLAVRARRRAVPPSADAARLARPAGAPVRRGDHGADASRSWLRPTGPGAATCSRRSVRRAQLRRGDLLDEPRADRRRLRQLLPLSPQERNFYEESSSPSRSPPVGSTSWPG